MNEISEALFQVAKNLAVLASVFLGSFLRWSLAIAWFAWWLWGVNWQKAWYVLAKGAWIPAILLMVIGALVWSQLAPSECGCLGFTTVPNFWWQMGAVGLLGATTLFCGWLQELFGWTPAPITFEPPSSNNQDHLPELH